jgi:hypothetical protein
MEYAAISKRKIIMKKLLFLSLFISLITITLDTHCMLRSVQQIHSRARFIALQQRWCTNSTNNQAATQKISALKTIRSAHIQQIELLDFEIAQLEQNQISAHNASLLPNYHEHHETHVTPMHNHDSYLPDYNMHYGNRNHDHKK